MTMTLQALHSNVWNKGKANKKVPWKQETELCARFATWKSVVLGGGAPFVAHARRVPGSCAVQIFLAKKGHGIPLPMLCRGTKSCFPLEAGSSMACSLGFSLVAPRFST